MLPILVFDEWENVFSLDALQPKEVDPVSDLLGDGQPQFRYKIHLANLHQSGTLIHILKRPCLISKLTQFLVQRFVLPLNRNGQLKQMVTVLTRRYPPESSNISNPKSGSNYRGKSSLPTNPHSEGRRHAS